MCLLFVLMSLSVCSQTGSEIYLLDVALTKSTISVGHAINVTNHPGYDNQPFFHTNQPLLYYASFNDDGRSDIKIYNYQTGMTNALTTTQEREYSPTLTLDAKFVSCIIQRDNGAQDLGKYPIGGGEAITLIDSLVVGYHAWADDHNLILFVLGETMTLQWYDLEKNTHTILDQDIGRALHKIPGQKAMSYVKKGDSGEHTINRLDIVSKKIKPIVMTLSGREDLTWTSDGKILMSDGEKLFFYDTKAKDGWKEVTMNLGDIKLAGISRLAISKDDKKLAVVVSE